jgi:hypothetical protein
MFAIPIGAGMVEAVLQFLHLLASPMTFVNTSRVTS